MRKSLVLMTTVEHEWQSLCRLLPEMDLFRVRNASQLILCMEENAVEAVMVSGEQPSCVVELGVLCALQQMHPMVRRILLVDGPTVELFELGRFGVVDFLLSRSQLHSAQLQQVDLSSLLLPQTSTTPLGYRRVH
ncbi:MAG: hypothetical protein GY822_03990 [Deltaproteobacteria bacterium]|nr:hypothetical protein [Deltaproteobacteria bacterium]